MPLSWTDESHAITSAIERADRLEQTVRDMERIERDRATREYALRYDYASHGSRYVPAPDYGGAAVSYGLAQQVVCEPSRVSEMSRRMGARAGYDGARLTPTPTARFRNLAEADEYRDRTMRRLIDDFFKELNPCTTHDYVIKQGMYSKVKKCKICRHTEIVKE